MLKFFRKIRQKALTGNRFSKYLLYAIGEIVLVVIGILIALKVNNWNQHQSDKAKFMTLLYELATDLAKEVDESQFVLESYYKRDSLINLNLAGKLVEEDLQAFCPECPRFLLLNYTMVPINTIAYDHIKSITDRIPKKYEHLTNEIKQLYEVDVKQLLDTQQSTRHRTNDFRQSLIANYPWFTQIPYSRLSAEAVDYFLNDPIYRNHLVDFRNHGKNYWTRLNQFRGRAIRVLYLIAQIGEVEMGGSLKEKAYLIDPSQAAIFSGRYRVPKFNNAEFTIKANESRIYTNLFPEGSIELVPQSDSSFYYSSRFIMFKFSKEAENSLSLVGSDGSEIVCEKIE